MRLIDETYLQARKVHGVINNVEGDFVSGATIAHAPTIDAVPVVRCKDCRYFKIYKCRMGYSRYDDFCSYGERKNGGSG